jgi:ABC-type uncharacterized transport system substrate-binding protein
MTGVSFFATGAKRFELLRELVPKAAKIALLVNPSTPASVSERTSIQAAANAVRQQIEVYNFTKDGDIDRALAMIAQRRGRLGRNSLAQAMPQSSWAASSAWGPRK